MGIPEKKRHTRKEYGPVSDGREWTGKIKRRDAHRGITAHLKGWIQ